MSTKGFIIGGSGSPPPKGYITVKYPEGSICTITHEEKGKVITAKDTSGNFVFNLPYIGRWTVTATDGTETASETVEVTSEGQNVNLELLYELVLFDGYNGGDNTAVTGGWVKSYGTGSISITESAIDINVSSSQGTNYAVVAKNKIDVTKFSSLLVTARLVDPRWGNPIVGLFDTSTRGNNTGAARLSWGTATNSDYVTKTLDIAAVTGEHYIGSKDTDPRFIIKKLWLR